MGGGLNNIFGGGQGGGGITGFIGGAIGSVGDVFGFAEGGSIKQVPAGFSGDTYPARLSSNELVIDQSTSGKLKQFLNGNNQSGDSISHALLNQILDALNQPVIVQTTAQVNDKAFADIILSLNRRNQRLTV
jgi:hypothetical protein